MKIVTQRVLKKKKVLFECLILGALITIGLRVPLMNIAALALFALMAFRSNREELLCQMIFLVSFAPIFKLQIGGFTFYNLVWIIALVRLLFMSALHIPHRKFAILLVFGVYALITGFTVDLIGTVSVICSLAVAMLLFQKGLQTYSVRKVVECAAWGVLFSSGIALIGPSLFPRLSTVLNKATIRLAAGVYYYRFSGLMENPNYYTMLVSVIQAVLCVLIIKRQARFTEYLYFFILTILGIMSASKSYMLTFAVLVILLIVYYCRNNVKGSLGWLMLIIVMGFVSYQFLGADTIEAILFRAERDASSGSDLDLITSGRNEMWQYYLNYLISHPVQLVFGRGLGAPNLAIGASHNYYIDMLYHLGIVGTLLYVGCLYSIFMVRKVRKNKVPLYYYLPYIVFLIRGMARNIIMSEQLIFYFALCALALSSATGKSNRIIT